MRLYRFVRVVALALFLVPVLPLPLMPTPAVAQTAEGGMCLEFSNDGTGFKNTCSYIVLITWCVINPDFPRTQEGKYHYGQSDCGKEESTGTLLRAGESRRESPRSLFTGGGIVWLECRPSNGKMTFNTMKTGRLIVGARPRFEATCMGGDGQIVPGFTATRQLSASSSRNDIAGGGGGVSPQTTVAVQIGLSGLWTGRSSGNQVTIEMRPGGFAQMLAGTQNAGQKAGEFFFRDAGSGLYLHTKPDGNDVRVQVLGPDTIRVTNPDGWTDVFERPSTVAANSTPFAGSTGAGLNAPTSGTSGATTVQEREGTQMIASSSSDERYWLKGRIVNEDSALCGQNCPPVGLKVVVHASDAYGSRLVGDLYPVDFSFGPPMTAGTIWRIDNPILTEFYECIASPSSGSVGADERSINVAFAVEVTRIRCTLNGAGKARLASFTAPPTTPNSSVTGQGTTAAGDASSAMNDGSIPSVTGSSSDSARASNEPAQLANSGSGGGGVSAMPHSTPLEAHNPANEASDCLTPIFNQDFEAYGVSSVMPAVFRNRCTFPVTATWCVGSGDCSTFDNLGTMKASQDNGISYVAPNDQNIRIRWAGCRLGFAYRPDLKGTLQYACK